MDFRDTSVVAYLPASDPLCRHLLFVALRARRVALRIRCPRGWGDIVVAATALLLLIFRPTSATVYRLWNIAGLADILMVVFTATRLALQDAASMAALLRLPLSLLPTFLVPLIIFTHIVIFFRLRYEGFTRAA